MTMYLDRIQAIINKFQGEDRRRLTEHYVSVSRRLLLNEREVRHSKIDLLRDLQSVEGGNTQELAEEVLDHKVLQVRALVLDLVNSDYSSDCETVYKPEKWIREITRDIRDTFDFDSEFEQALFASYNKKLLEEFCKIFISGNRRFGTNGNQLLLNLYHYRAFVLRRMDLQFDGFFHRVRVSFREGCDRPEQEILRILAER